MRNYPVFQISEKGEKKLREGHVWAFDEELTLRSGNPRDGEIVDIFSQKDKYVGSGFFNSSSKIRIRVISKSTNDRFDESFWRRRLSWAIRYRWDVMGETDFRCCRLIFGEADQFPGLTVDRFENILVFQILSLGMELLKNELVSWILDILRQEYGVSIDAVYERSDVAVREHEGLSQTTGYLYQAEGFSDDLGITQITENGIRYSVDYIRGQKTGFFLDQKYNRAAVAKLCRGKKVLDCCTHTGSFALNAARAGALSVTALDVSGEALDMVRKNAELNGLSDRIETVKADLFDYLETLQNARTKPYDVIILDPPAFTKSRDTLKNAIKGYGEINERAMRILPRGGYLATCSCSHFMTETYFKQMLHGAAERAQVSLRQIEARRQSPDHPILWNVPETDYLKFFIFQII